MWPSDKKVRRPLL